MESGRPCTDPWDPAYDEEFARSGIIRHDLTVLPPDRFLDEPMSEQDKRELLGPWYEASVQAGPSGSSRHSSFGCTVHVVTVDAMHRLVITCTAHPNV